MIATPRPPQEPIKSADDMKAFLMVVRRALLLVVEHIERRYGLERKH